MQRLVLEGIIELRGGAGTFLRHAAAATKLFGLIVPGLSEKELMQAICGHMARAAEVDKYTLVWGDALDLPGEKIGSRAIEIAGRYVGMKCEGDFFAPLEYMPGTDAANHKVVRLCKDAGIPVVLIDRDIVAYPERSSYDVVGVDSRRAMN